MQESLIAFDPIFSKYGHNQYIENKSSDKK